MATLTRNNNSRPSYKEYMNFIDGYNKGKNNDEDKMSSKSDSGISSFANSLTNSNNTSSSSIASIDVTDNSHKFGNNKNKHQIMKKSEIYIEIQNSPPTTSNSVSEVSKIFEIQPKKSVQKSETIQETKTPINNTIKMFESQISKEDDPKIANKPRKSITIQRLASHLSDHPQNQKPSFKSPPLQKSIKSPLVAQFENDLKNNAKTESKNQENALVPPPPVANFGSMPPPPPMMPPQYKAPKITQNLAINNKSNPTAPSQTQNNTSAPKIDKNDPAVKKLVYGTLRTMYGAYHGKANEYVATLPEMMVKKDNNIQNILNNLESTGDLVKLNGRVNPKAED